MIIGGFFVISGAEKLIQPYANFLYVVQNYDVVHGGLAELAARCVPWIELFCGLFMIFGLWLNIVLRISWLMPIVFMGVVSQAIIRKLPIHECGCFGELASIPLPIVLLFDSFLLIMITILIFFKKRTSSLSLDSYFFKYQSS